MGGPGLPETRSVWLTSALNLSACRPIDPQLLGGQRSRSVRSSTVHPLVQETAFVRTLDKRKKKSQSVCVCVHARLPRAHCRVYKGELFVCSVSLCHGDFTTVIWFLSPSAALHSVSSLVPSMLFHGRVFFVVVFFFFFKRLTNVPFTFLSLAHKATLPATLSAAF